MKKIKYKTVPLSGGFMITSIIGFIVVLIYTNSGRLSATWGVTFGVVFTIMFIASLVSITPTFSKPLNKIN